jgi:hypothetical protein
MVGRIIWSSMVWPAYFTMLNIATGSVFWLGSGFVEAAMPMLSLAAGWWAGALLVCGAFWRLGWRRPATRRLYLWGIGGSTSTVLLVVMVIADVIPLPPAFGWLVVFWATCGLGLGAGITALHIASWLRREDRIFKK